jgi:FkbM family methyltransferase
MSNNVLAIKTFNYIWSHPNCQQHKLQSISKFVGWQLYKRFTHQYLDIQLLPNIKLRCYPDSRSAAAVLYCGLYDYDDMNFLLRYLRSNDSFLDIGANIGVYTLLAASKINDGKIYSFEVLPKNFARLQENLKLNDLNQVDSYELAVSNQPGNISLDLAEGDSMPFITHTATNTTISVPTDTLDDLLKNQQIDNLTLAKIDIEGAELLAFQGAVSLLKQQRPLVWIMEINDTVKNLGHQKQEVVEFIQSYGYSLYSYNADTNQISPITIETKQGNNVLAIADCAVNFVCDRLSSYCLK